MRRQPLRDVVNDDVDPLAESFGAGELLSVINHVHAEADFVRELRDEVADVPGAKHVDVRRCLHRFDEDFHLPSANEPGLLREIVVQLVLNVQRATVRDRLAGFPERVVLVTAAPDRADRAAVRVDEHLCPNALRRGPMGGDDRDERNFFPALECLRQGGKDLLVH